MPWLFAGGIAAFGVLAGYFLALTPIIVLGCVSFILIIVLMQGPEYHEAGLANFVMLMAVLLFVIPMVITAGIVRFVDAAPALSVIHLFR